MLPRHPFYQGAVKRDPPFMRRIDKDVATHGACESEMIAQPQAAAAVYDRKSGRILIQLTNGLHLSLPVALAKGLAGESSSDLEDIRISPAGLTLYWPKLDAELYLPALLTDILGTREGRWHAYWARWGHGRTG
jgi:protein involved in temperature-dependent protein secretion